MSIRMAFRNERALTSGWIAGKGIRAAMLLGSLLILSIALTLVFWLFRR